MQNSNSFISVWCAQLNSINHVAGIAPVLVNLLFIAAVP